MDYAELIGSNIRYERRRRGLTIDDFAKIIGMAPGFLGLIERGQRGTSIKNMVQMAHFFGISLDDLITRDLSKGERSTDEDNSRVGKSRRALESLTKALNDDEVVFITSVIKAMNRMSTGLE